MSFSIIFSIVVSGIVKRKPTIYGCHYKSFPQPYLSSGSRIKFGISKEILSSKPLVGFFSMCSS